MNITVLKGESTDLLKCDEPNADPFYVVVPKDSTDQLRSAADWRAYFANGKWSDNIPPGMRAAQRTAHVPPAQASDGYAVGLEHRRGNVTPISASARFATGHSGSPDGYAIALAARATVRQFPNAAATSNSDGYAAALTRRKES